MSYRRLLIFIVSVALLGGGFNASASAQATTTTSAQGGVPQESEIPRITLDELKALIAQRTPVLILDVRGPSETKIKGALHIPLYDLEAHLNELPRDREIVTYCA